MLEVTGGDLVYWEVCGNPEGKPAVVLHGGPGSGCTAWHRRLFDPAAYRVVLFDQRGCGRSRPHVPSHVTELILFGVTTGRREEFDWLFRDGLGALFPEEWERRRSALPVADRDGDVVEAPCRLLHDSDPAVREGAARAWCLWESATPEWPPVTELAARFRDPSFAMAYARLVTHYVRHDFQAPITTAWRLHRLWPRSKLVVVNDAGHAASSPGITSELLRATDCFANA